MIKLISQNNRQISKILSINTNGRKQLFDFSHIHNKVGSGKIYIFAVNRFWSHFWPNNKHFQSSRPRVKKRQKLCSIIKYLRSPFQRSYLYIRTGNLQNNWNIRHHFDMGSVHTSQDLKVKTKVIDSSTLSYRKQKSAKSVKSLLVTKIFADKNLCRLFYFRAKFSNPLKILEIYGVLG